jgi:hypothetical protein
MAIKEFATGADWAAEFYQAGERGISQAPSGGLGKADISTNTHQPRRLDFGAIRE